MAFMRVIIWRVGPLSWLLGAIPNMQLNVKKINQMASGGSYVVIYQAELELLNELTFTAEVLTVEPNDTLPELVELARLSILQGAEHVLEPIGRGAIIRINHLVINDTDFKPWRFKMFTALEIEQLLGEEDQQNVT